MIKLSESESVSLERVETVNDSKGIGGMKLEKADAVLYVVKDSEAQERLRKAMIRRGFWQSHARWFNPNFVVARNESGGDIVVHMTQTCHKCDPADFVEHGATEEPATEEKVATKKKATKKKVAEKKVATEEPATEEKVATEEPATEEKVATKKKATKKKATKKKATKKKATKKK